ncbi:hypothetical protein M2280_003224 [Prescottella agglutinans]|uniref:FAD-dependent oxidoreductase 2 FAD-binding domain-containing protein n=1 Tax=Prescottella agglutinans TaxID=1644129 RepID=A0ABT6MCF4_9NOCA|nr:hypothetical protein [Prescottella agglutinans]
MDPSDGAVQGPPPDSGRGNEPYDGYFNADGNPLVPLEQGPFYAAQFGISDLGTKGGLVTDTTARVLDTSGSVILGLYASAHGSEPLTANHWGRNNNSTV